MVITFESRKKSYPVYLFVFSYVLTALIFKDRWQYIIGIAMALTLFLGAYGLGKRLSFLIFKTADQSLYFPIGLGTILLITFIAASYSTSRPVFYAIWGLLAVLGAFEFPILGYRLNRNYFFASPLILLAFWSSFTPSISPTTLEYFLGMAHQYLALGKMITLPHNLYSALAPFGNSLSLLFSSPGFDCGIKAFLLIVYFQIVSIMVALLRWLITEPVFAGGNGRDAEYQTDLLYMTRTELLVVPMLLFPGLFAVLHNQTYDLLAALFFCAAISSLMKEYDMLNSLKIISIGLLVAFSLWTKTSVLFYVPWIALLWLGLTSFRFTRANFKAPGSILLASVLLWLPLLIRNAVYFGDPFYPALSGILSETNWSPAQSLLFEGSLMGGSGGLLDAFARFAALVFDPQGVGIVMLVSLVVYPFSRKMRMINQLLFFGLACYITWFFLFQDFRFFLPVYVLLFPVSYFAFRYLYIRSPRYLWIAWACCAALTIIPLFKLFSATPMIHVNESQDQFLTKQLDYYPIAKSLNSRAIDEKVLMLGDSRLAYYKEKMLAGSPYDATAILADLQASSSAEELYGRLRRRGIRFIVFRQNVFEQFYGQQGVFVLTEIQMQNWKKLVQSYTRLQMKSGDIQLLELSNTSSF